jgi:hypothetical protein
VHQRAAFGARRTVRPGVQHPVTGLTTASLEAAADHTADASKANRELGYGRADAVAAGGRAATAPASLGDDAARYVDRALAMRAAQLWAAHERERALAL